MKSAASENTMITHDGPENLLMLRHHDSQRIESRCGAAIGNVEVVVVEFTAYQPDHAGTINIAVVENLVASGDLSALR
jgi:hypothetical protein